MNRIYIILGAFFIFSQTLAQDFRKGFIITNEGDTVTGYVDYKNLEACIFKRSAGEKSYYTYAPDDIKGFGFDFNRMFLSKKVGPYQSLFLECLVLGSASLYRDKITFYLEAADTILALKEKSKKTYVSRDNTTGIFQYKKYIGIIKILLKDCPPAPGESEKIRYNKKALIKLVENYNNCVSSDYTTYHSKLPWIKIGYGANAGYVHSVLRETPYCNRDLDLLSNQPLHAHSFTLGGNFYISWSRIIQSLNMTVGIQWLNSKFRIQEVLKDDSTDPSVRGTYYVNGNYKSNELLFPVGVRQTFGQGNYKPYLDAGIIFIQVISGSADGTIEVEYEEEVNTYNGGVCFKPNRIGYFFGMGVEHAISKKIKGLAEFRFEYNHGPVYMYGTNYPKINFSFTVGIKY